VRLDSFEKVKAAIDKMISTLKKEADEEVKHKDYCNTGFHDNAMDTAEKENQAEDLKVKIADLSSTIDTTGKEIADLESNIADMNTEMKRASENRVQENKDFQSMIADQREAQVILKQALQKLAKFYSAKSFTQISVNTNTVSKQAPPPGFSPYKHNQASGSAMQMIKNVITDAGNMEKEAVRAEQDAQVAYEAFVAETNRSVEKAQRAIVDKKDMKATAEGGKAQADADLTATNKDLESLAAFKGELHVSCDFVTANFEVRQKARQEELDSLAQAKAILSGSI